MKNARRFLLLSFATLGAALAPMLAVIFSDTRCVEAYQFALALTFAMIALSLADRVLQLVQLKRPRPLVR